MDGKNYKKHDDIVHTPWIAAENIPHLKQDFGKSTALQHDCDRHHQNAHSKIISMAKQDKLTPELKPPSEMRQEADRNSFDSRWLALARDAAMANATTEQAHHARKHEQQTIPYAQRLR